MSDATLTGHTAFHNAQELIPPSPVSGLQDIERFLDAMWSERGLAENTLSAYRADLVGLCRWLDSQHVGILLVQREHLLEFLAWRVQQGARPRSTARQLSSIRRFYRYMLREGRIHEDPSTRIDMPKLGRPLPKSLTENEVVALLKAPDTSQALGRA